MTTQPDLFGGMTTDDVVRSTRRTKDEQQHERIKRRGKIRSPDRPIPDGPCCGRCAFWRAPMGEDRYGECVALASVGPGSRDGYVASIEDAAEQDRTWDYLRTTGWYEGCRAYVARKVDP